MNASVSSKSSGARARSGTDMDPDVLEVVIKNGVPDSVKFICPCGCGDKCFLCLVTPERPRLPQDDPNKSPVWDWHGNNHLMWPSIHAKHTCGAHFFLEMDGKVRWT